METNLTTTVESPQETFELARSITSGLECGDVLGLTGPLGAGKTVFVKGMARELGMEDAWQNVTSPTYTLQDVYHLNETLFHCDAYRLQESDQFLSLGWVEQFPEGITVFEWVDRFLPEIEPYLSGVVRIKLTGERSREIVVTAKSEEVERVLTELRSRHAQD